jgi:hypothetical protein
MAGTRKKVEVQRQFFIELTQLTRTSILALFFFSETLTFVASHPDKPAQLVRKVSKHYS